MPYNFIIFSPSPNSSKILPIPTQLHAPSLPNKRRKKIKPIKKQKQQQYSMGKGGGLDSAVQTSGHFPGTVACLVPWNMLVNC